MSYVLTWCSGIAYDIFSTKDRSIIQICLGLLELSNDISPLILTRSSGIMSRISYIKDTVVILT
jgi:hypothetical protein